MENFKKKRKAEKNENSLANRGKRRVKAGQRKRGARVARKENRAKRKELRVGARNQRKTAKISSRNAKKLSKIYGELSPEQVNELNKIQPYVGAMADELNEKGVPLDDDTDPIEVATKFSMNEESIENPMDEDEFQEAFIDEEETFESLDKYNKRRAVAKSVLTGIVSGVSDYANTAADKQKQGLPLTDAERGVLNAKNDAVSAGKSQFIADNMNKIVLLLVFAVVAVVVFKK